MLTACIALGVAGTIGGFVAGIVVGGNEVALSARHRIAAAHRAQDRAIARSEDLEAEVEHWKSVAASPVSALLAASRSARA